MPAMTKGQTRPTMSRSAWRPLPDAVGPGQALGGVQLPDGDLVDERLNVPLQPQPSDHPAGDDRYRQPESDVERRRLPAEEAEEEHDGDLVHHRRRDEEGERHAQRHARLDEADEQRHRRAGAERRHDAESRRRDVADTFPAAAQKPARALRREERPDDAHQEDDAREEEQDLRGIVEEEVDGAAQVAVR